MKWTHDVSCVICSELHNKALGDGYIKQICENCDTENRILFEDENFAIIPSLGPVSDCHILVVPKQHINAYALLDSELLDLAENLVKKILKITRKKYGRCVIFEHGVLDEKMSGSASCNHAHIHIVSFDKSLLPLLEKDNLQIREVHRMCELVKQKDRNKPYFYYCEDGKRAFIMDDTVKKSQYMRMMAAEILQTPEKGNWKKIQVFKMCRKC